MAHAWPTKVHYHFDCIPPNSMEQRWYPPWTHLLFGYFILADHYSICHQDVLDDATRRLVDITIRYRYNIRLIGDPMFVLEIKRASDFLIPSARAVAEEQLRERLQEYINQVQMPRLYGISTFGTRFGIWTIYKSPTGRISFRPSQHGRTPLQNYVSDTSPATLWPYDLLSREGKDAFEGLIEKVKADVLRFVHPVQAHNYNPPN